MSRRSSDPPVVRFDLEALEPRLLLSGDGMVPLSSSDDVRLDLSDIAPSMVREVVLIEESDSESSAFDLEWAGKDDGESLFDLDYSEDAGDDLKTGPAVDLQIEESESIESDQESAEVYDSTSTVLPKVSDSEEAPGEVNFFNKQQSWNQWSGLDPPVDETELFDVQAVASYDLTNLLSDALQSIEEDLADWVAYYNLTLIDWSGQGREALSLAVSPDSINDLLDLSSAVSGVDFPALVAETKSTLVDELVGLGFDVTAIEGGLNDGTYNIASTTGTDRILASWSTSLASGIGVSGSYTGDTFDSSSEGLLDGVGSGLTPSDTLSWSADLSLEFDLGVDDSGFFIGSGSGLSLAMDASGSLAGTADLFGGTDSSLTIDATADLNVGLEFNSTSTRYRLDAIASELASIFTATASGTAEAKISFSHGPTNLVFDADYSMSTSGLDVTQTVNLGLSGTLELPGFTFAADGTPAVLDITGSYDSDTGTWTLSANTAELKAFGFSVSSASFSVTGTATSFSGSGAAAMEIDFLSNSSSPLSFNLDASFDEATLSIDATASVTDLSFEGNSGSVLFSAGASELDLSLMGDFDAGTLTGSIGFDIASAQLNPGQSTYTASVTDGDDADSSALSGEYDFAAASVSLNVDQLSLFVEHVIQASVVGVVLQYSRSSSQEDQTILTISTIDVELLGFTEVSGGTAPKFSASQVVVRESGFSIADGSLSAADLRIGDFVDLTNPTLAVSGLSYDGSGLSGTIEVSAENAVLFSGSSFTATLSDGDDSDSLAIGGSFDASTLAFSLSVDQLSVNVPDVFSAEGSGITLGYDPNGDAHQEIFRLEDLTLTFLSFETSPGANLSASVSGLSFYADGFAIDNVSIPASGSSLGTVSIGGFLDLTNPTLQISDLSYVDGSGLSGTIGVSAENAVLFSGSSFTATLSDGDDSDSLAIGGSFDASTLAFSLTIDQFDVSIGEAARMSGEGIAIAYDPNGAADQEIVQVDKITVTSPLFSNFGSVELTSFILRADGFSFSDLSLTQTSQEARIGNYLAASGVVISASDFDVSFGGSTTVTGSISLTATSISLFPDGGLITSKVEDFNGSFVFRNGGSGELKITVGTFALAVGEALEISASNVVLTPSEDPILTIETALVTSPALESFGSAVVENLEVGQTQFSVESLTLSQPAGQTTTLGGFLAFSGVQLVVAGASAGESFTVNYGGSGDPVSGTVTLTADSIQLFPNGGTIQSDLTDFVASYDFDNGGKLSIAFSTFSFSLGEAFVLKATDSVTITPGEDVLATIGQLDVTSPSFSSVSFSITNFVLRRDGFSMDSAVLNLGTVSSGSFITYDNAVLTLAGPDESTPFTVNYGDSGSSVEGTIVLTVDSVALFPGSGVITSNFSGVSIEYDFSDAGRLHIHVDSFNLQVGEALSIVAPSAVDITPGAETIVSISEVTVTSPQFGAGAGSFTLSDLAIKQDGFFLGNGSLAIASASFGSFLDLTTIGVEVDNFGLTFGSETEVTGSITVTLASAELFPNGGYLTSSLNDITGRYDFDAGSGALSITVGEFSLSVGEALKIAGQNIEITPGSDTIATLGSAVLTSPSFTQFGSATVTGLEITQTGFSVENITLSQADGAPVWIGNFLKFSGLEIVIAGSSEGESFTVVSGEAPSGTITVSATSIELFPNGGVIQSDLQGFVASYDFDNGGALQISFTRFAFSIGEALQLLATGESGSDAPVTISPSSDVIASIPNLQISSPLISGLEAATITDLEIRQDGFSFQSAQISQTQGTTATIGSVLSVSGASITASGPDASTPFSVSYGDSGVSLDGEITFVADSVSLFPDSGFFTTTITGLNGSYDFSSSGAGALRIGLETLQLNVGEALRLDAGTAGVADGIVISPGSDTIVSINSLTVSSPLITSGLNTATVSNFEIHQNGFEFDELTISQVSGQTASIGSFLSFTELQISVSNFAYSTDDGVSGAVLFSADTILLFPSSTLVTSNLSGISGSFDFDSGGAGNLSIGVQTFNMLIGEALTLDASSITITPGADTIAQIGSATANSPRLANLGSVSVENLAIRQDGFSFSSLTISQKTGVVSTFGNFLSFSGVVLTVTGPESGGDFDLSFGGSGTTISGAITISIDSMTLFPDAQFMTSSFTGVTGAFDFAGGTGSLEITIDSFTLAIGEAFELQASGSDPENPITITPGQSTLLSVPSVTVSSSLVKGLDSGSITDLIVTQTGFSFSSLSLTQASGTTATIGSVFEFADASLDITDFSVGFADSTWSVGGSVEISVGTMSLFPSASFLTSTFTGVDASFGFGSSGVGSLSISFSTLDLQIGEALKITSDSGGSFTPGQLTMLVLNDLSVSAPGIQGMGTGSIERLIIRQDGLSIGSLSIGQADGATASFGSFLTVEGARLTVSNFSLVNGDDGVSVSGGIVFTADALNLFPGSSSITTEISSFTGSYTFGDGSGTLEISVGTFKLAIGAALELNASSVTITPGSETIATLQSASIKAPQFSNLPEVTLSDGVVVTQTGFTIGQATIAQGANQTATLGSIFSFTGLSVSLTNFEYTFGETPSFDGIVVAATSASVFPGSSLFTAQVDGFSGSYANNDLALTATKFTFSFGTSLSVEADGISFTPSADTIAHADSITASIPSLGVSGTGTGLDISSGGDFSIVSVSLDTSGLAQSLGFGSLLPFNITALDLTFLGDTNGNGQKDPGETFSLTAFDLTVSGTFNFSSLQSLPFTPIIRIGVEDDVQPPGDGSTQSGSGVFDSADDPFSFTIEVVNGDIRPKDLGPITLGFADLSIGSTVVMSGSITLGGYQDGEWVSSFAGNIQMENSSSVSGITGGSVSIVGSYDGDEGRLVAYANLTVSFKMGSSISVTNAGLGFNMIVSSGSGSSVTLEKLELTSASVQEIDLSIGDFLTMTATNVALDFNPGPGEYIATFGSITAQVTAGSFSVGGTARHFAIDSDGDVAVLSGFSVSLTISSSDSISWPSWLPIDITEAGLTWDNFSTAPEKFQLTISASVKSINGLSAFNIQGSVEGLVIDFGLLEAGKFPITDIGSAAVSVSGDAFGGTIEGALVLGVVKIDANGNRIDSTDTDTTVEDRVLYGAIQAGFTFAGTAGFSIRIGLSELGPLQLYMEASIPVLLDPNTGLSITDFRAGVTFDATIPDPGDDPHNMEGAAYQPPDSLTLEQWVAQLEEQVVNQVSMGAGWDSIGNQMIFQAGATLYSAYLSTYTFKADIDFIFDTTGKFIIDASMVYGETLTQSATLYFDLSQLAEGSGKILFLAKQPTANDPLVTIFGELSFGFTREDGTPVSSTNQADSFEIRLSGGVDFSALSFLTATIQGSVTMTFSSNRFDLALDGQMSVSYVGDLLEMSGALHIEVVDSGVNVWGAMVITTPALAKLEQVGIFANGDFILRLNFTDNAYTETLTLPSGNQVSVDLPEQSFSVLVEGYFIFKLEGVEWFRMEGSFGMEVSETGLKVFAIGELLIGPSSSPWITFDFNGLLWIGDEGVAALLDLTLNTGFPESTGITLSGSFLLQLNTSGQEISYTLPDSISAIPGGGTSRTLTVSGTAPVDDATAGPYLVVTGELDLGVLGFTFNGSFDFVVTTEVLRIEADATLLLVVEGISIFEFEVQGGFQVDGKGIIAAFAITRSANSPDPSSFGFSLDVTFQLELNTTNAPAVIGGIQLESGRYARVSMSGDLVVEGFTMNGMFELTVGEDLLKIEADASMDLTVNDETLFAFNVAGGFQINQNGIAAVFDIGLSADIPDKGFEFDVSFTFEINTTDEAITLAGVDLEAGPFGRIAASGTLTVSGIVLEGDFSITLTTDYVQITADASLDVTIADVDIFSFSVSGDLRFGSDGLAAILDLSLSTGPPSSLGFSVSFTFGLKINTTNQEVVFPDATLTAGVYATITGQGDLIVSGLTLTGGFEFTVGTDLLSVSVNASLDLTIDGTTLLSFSVAGGMQIDSEGIAAVIDISLSAGGGLPSGYGISLNVSFQLQINTRSDGITIAGITLDPGPYGKVQLSGDLTIFGFKLSGTFYISVGADQFTLGGSATFSIFNASASIILDFGMFSDGMAGRVELSLNRIDVADLFVLTGSFGIEFNTTNRTVFDIDPLTGQVYVKNAELTILGLSLSGSVYIGVDNGVFQILVPSSDPLTVDFFGIVTVQVYGYVRGDGNFSITGTASISLGRQDIVGISGSMSVTIANTGLAAAINGSLVAFNQSVASLNGYVSINGTGLRIVADIKFKLPDPFDLISLDGHLDATISSSGIKGSISATVKIWNFLSGSVGAYLDTSTGSWFVSGTASVSVGNSYLGASGSITLGVGYLSQGMTLFGSFRNAGFNTQVYFKASAWAGIKIAGKHIGISGSISANLDLSEGRASVTIHGKVLFISFSKTITVEFKNGLRVYLSDVAGSTVFLDVNGNGMLDDGEPTTIADEDGSFSFAEDETIDQVDAPALSPFDQIDTNDDGLIDDDEGEIILIGGTSLIDGSTNTVTDVLEHDLLSGITSYTGATVFVDVNGNRQLDEGEYSVTTDANGAYDLTAVLYPTESFDAATYLGELADYDTNGNGLIDDEEGTLTLTGGTVISTGSSNSTTITLSGNSPTGFTDYADATVFLDLNGNGTLDSGEPSVTSEDSGSYSFVVDATPDTTSITLGELAKYDLNGNGVLDADEGQLYIVGGFNSETGDANSGAVAIGNDHLSGYAPYYDVERIFFDANNNGQYDDGEATTVPDSTNFYTFTGYTAPTNGLGRLAPYDTNGNGVIDSSEGTFMIIGGKDTNNGLTNEQAVAIQANGAGSGVRHVASPLTSLLDDLQDRGIDDEDARLKVAAGLGIPYYVDFETFDPSVDEELNPDSTFHHEVEGASTQVGALLLNGADALIGAANGNLSKEDAQTAILAALADRIADVTPESTPPTDGDGNLIAAAALVDLTDESVVDAILQDAAGRLSIVYTEEPSADTSSLVFKFREKVAFSNPDAISMVEGALVQRADDGSQRLIVTGEVSGTAANVISIQNSHIDELVAAHLDHVTEALSRVKAIAQSVSSDRLTHLAQGNDSSASIRDDFDYESLLHQIDALDIPYPNAAPIVSIITEASGNDNSPLLVPFTVFDPDALPHDVAFTITSSNPEVLSVDDVSIEGTGSGRTLVITPNGSHTGVTVLTIEASDEGRENSTTSVELVVFVRPGVLVAQVEQIRNGDGSEVLRFAVALTSPSNLPIEVNYQTLDGSAFAGLDYIATSGRLTFAPGETIAYVDVSIIDDDFLYEDSETIFLELSVESGAHSLGSLFAGIIEDSGFPVIVILEGETARISLDALFNFESDFEEDSRLEFFGYTTDPMDCAGMDLSSVSKVKIQSHQWTDLAMMVRLSNSQTPYQIREI